MAIAITITITIMSGFGTIRLPASDPPAAVPHRCYGSLRETRQCERIAPAVAAAQKGPARPRRHHTRHFLRKRATSAPAAGPAYGLNPPGSG